MADQKGVDLNTTRRCLAWALLFVFHRKSLPRTKGEIGERRVVMDYEGGHYGGQNSYASRLRSTGLEDGL